MREFKHTTGGRYDYSEDIHGLQEFANALNSIFEECGKNFVINGCNISGTECSKGYVWLGGKIRCVPSASITLGDKEVIYIEVDDVEGNLIDYGDGSKGVMNISYGAKYNHGEKSSIEDNGNVLIYENDQFPDLNNVFFLHYSLTKSGNKQVFSTPITASQLSTYFYSGVADDAHFSIYNGDYEMRFGYNDVAFYVDEVLVYKWHRNRFYQYAEEIFGFGTDSGEIDIPSMPSLQSLTSKTNIDVTDSIKISGDDIKTIFAYTNYPFDTGWKNLINPITNKAIATLYVRQRKERVIIKGVLPKEYVTSFSDKYVTILDKQGNNVSDSSWLVYKLNAKLPNGVTPPNASRLPGCVISSNYQATENLSCNNVELHVGADNYLYIIGKPINMNWHSDGPTINLNYLID